MSWLDMLDRLGYNNYWKVMDASDYGIPQHRERVFCISVRKDIDKGFYFPDPEPLQIHLFDLLEDDVDEKYYISDAYIKYAESLTVEMTKAGNGFKFELVERE